MRFYVFANGTTQAVRPDCQPISRCGQVQGTRPLSSPKTVRRYQCAETIKVAAKTCRFCGFISGTPSNWRSARISRKDDYDSYSPTQGCEMASVAVCGNF